jgi:formyltetrahydrofolate deformylase
MLNVSTRSRIAISLFLVFEQVTFTQLQGFSLNLSDLHSKKITKAMNPTIIARLHGPDQPGLVAKVSNWIWERGGNILHADQHRDNEMGVFFQRVEWIPNANKLDDHIRHFSEYADDLNMHCEISVSDERKKVALFVSKFDHCFHDLILRQRAGEFMGNICCVISNHPDLSDACLNYGLEYHHIPVAASEKESAEKKQLEVLHSHNIELVVLARYMQVLSSEFLKAYRGSVINVHHSFLPAFAGARPYHQAHSKGVKLIGATAHYATEDLDEGPIIAQVVTPVSHRHTVGDLIRKGRDLEKSVLAQAVRFHLEQRILCYGNKTVVFD